MDSRSPAELLSHARLGISVILAPLAAGQHTVQTHYRYGPPNGESGDVVYHLTIRR